MIFGLGLAWLFFALLIGALANKYGRSGFGWFILSVVISPLLAGLLLIVLLLPGAAAEIRPTHTLASSPPTKRCPLCAELISLDAIKCKHCGSDIRIAETEAKAKEHVFTITCYECQAPNNISSATIHNFPKCLHCGKNIIDLKRKKHKSIVLAYINNNKDKINDKVYSKLINILEPL